MKGNFMKLWTLSVQGGVGVVNIISFGLLVYWTTSPLDHWSIGQLIHWSICQGLRHQAG